MGKAWWVHLNPLDLLIDIGIPNNIINTSNCMLNSIPTSLFDDTVALDDLLNAKPTSHMPGKLRPEDSDETEYESEVCLEEILMPEDMNELKTAPLCDSSRNTINWCLETP